MDVIRALTPKLIEIADRYGVNYSAWANTNGFALTPTIGNELLTLHSVEGFCITLDGTSDAHDQRRPLSDGSGTFDKIHDNILGILGLVRCKGISPDILLRSNIDSENIEGVTRLIQDLSIEGIHKYVQLEPARVQDWGGFRSSDEFTVKDYAPVEINFLVEALTMDTNHHSFQLEYLCHALPQVNSILLLTVVESCINALRHQTAPPTKEKVPAKKRRPQRTSTKSVILILSLMEVLR